MVVIWAEVLNGFVPHNKSNLTLIINIYDVAERKSLSSQRGTHIRITIKCMHTLPPPSPHTKVFEILLS